MLRKAQDQELRKRGLFTNFRTRGQTGRAKSQSGRMSFFYCAPCRIKVLAAPLGGLSASCFSNVVEQLRQRAVVPLQQLASDERLAKAMLSPAAFPRGQLVFEVVTEWDAHYAYLEDFQHWRKLYAVQLFSPSPQFYVPISSQLTSDFQVIAIRDDELASEDLQMQQLDALRAKV